MPHYITYFEIAAFFASLIAWPVIKSNTYLRLFPLLLFIVVSVETYETFFRNGNQKNNALVYNIQVPAQYLVYFAILYFAINNKKFKKLIIFLSIIFPILAIITEISFKRPGSFNSWAYSLGSIIVIIGIIYRFIEIFQSDEWDGFITNPFFYMLLAFLIFNIGTLPYFIMANWLWFHRNDRQTVILLYNVMSVLNYILYSTYTIAFLWMKKKGIYLLPQQ